MVLKSSERELSIKCVIMTDFFNFPLDILGYSNGSIGAVTVTVIVIHVIMGFYIWVAIKEEEVTQQLKQD